VAIVCGVAFVKVERRRAQPMVPLQLFRRPAFMVGNVAGAVIHFGGWGTLLVLTLSFQDIRGWSAFQTGLAMLPMGAIGGPIAVLAGRAIARRGARGPMLAGLVISAAAAAFLATTDSSTPYVLLAVGMAGLTTGMGLSLPAAVSVVTSQVG